MCLTEKLIEYTNFPSRYHWKIYFDVLMKWNEKKKMKREIHWIYVCFDCYSFVWNSILFFFWVVWFFFYFDAGCSCYYGFIMVDVHKLMLSHWTALPISIDHTINSMNRIKIYTMNVRVSKMLSSYLYLYFTILCMLKHYLLIFRFFFLFLVWKVKCKSNDLTTIFLYECILASVQYHLNLHFS